MATELFTCVVGSTLHRTTTPQSDVDTRSVYALSLSDRLSPFVSEKVKTVHGDNHESVSFEFSHFARFIAKNNPTAMEILLSDAAEGFRTDLIPPLLHAALDTELYVKQTNGMILGMQRKGSPKSLHHAERLRTHLRLYANTGLLLLDASTYNNYDYLMAIKRGEVVPEDREPIEVNHKFHTQDLDRLSQIVYDVYVGS